MTAFLAMIGDTWRLSRKQVVFIILLVLLTLLAGFMIAVVKVNTTDDGELVLGDIFSDRPENRLAASQWYQGYRLVNRLGQERPPEGVKFDSPEWDEYQERVKARRKETTDNLAPPSRLERSVVGWHYFTQSIMVVIAMWLFIAAAAGYFPGLMEAGAIDVVLSKPMGRLKIFAGRFVGGLVFLGGAVLLFQLIMYVGLGLRTGIWYGGAFASITPIMFTAALLYSVVAFLGILSRSAVFALTVGYFLYIAVDSGLKIFSQVQLMGELEDYPFFDNLAIWLREWIPNFSTLQELSTASVLAIPDFDWRPFYIGGLWLAASLSAGFFIFKRRDF